MLAMFVWVALLDATNATLSQTTLSTDANGKVSVANDALATQVQVTDRFGNVTTVAIQ